MVDRQTFALGADSEITIAENQKNRASLIKQLTVFNWNHNNMASAVIQSKLVIFDIS
jgi:hypothetical protein